MTKNFIQISLLCFFSVAVFGQIPNNYYIDAQGKADATLKTALYNKISAHTERSYSDLWTDFQTTDKRADGKVWDIYSSTTNYVFGTNQCGNYSGEGSCYNREHSFPKSWFKDGKPMYSDLFHLYPSDGYVNGKRSNYPFGEVGTTSYTSNNNYSKLGSCSFPGYTGIVFEPTDSLKGDLARGYFYMVTAYEDNISTWNSVHLDGSKFPAFTKWTIALLLKWHRLDPVSSKELKRNNAVYGIQKNRNPYIDYPSLAEYIWGNSKGLPWSKTSAKIENTVLNFKISYRSGNKKIYVESDTMPLYYIIYSLQAQAIQTGMVNTDKTIAVDNLSPDIYLIDLKAGNKNIRHKFIVE